MKKAAFTFLLLFSCCHWLAAQCPASITFSTQGQVDSFRIHYPNCSVIPGNVVITDSSIVRLDSLSALKKIGGQFRIQGTSLPDLKGLDKLESVKLSFQIIGNPALTGLNGLGNLKSVGTVLPSFPGIDLGFEILDNPLLASLHGLDKLTTATGCVRITNNPLLTSLAGLGSLSAVGACGFLSDNAPGYVDAGLEIGGNASLTTLEGIGNIDSLALLEIFSNPFLTSVKNLKGVHRTGSVRISDNPALSSLDGLDQVQSISRDLLIWGMPALKSLAPFGNLQKIGGNLLIGPNASLKSLSGLDNIRSIGGGLDIGGNDSLATLSGLEKLDSLGQCLDISSNPALVSFDALAGLRSIGRCRQQTGIHSFIFWNLHILDNPQLGSIQGLEQASIKTTDLVRITGCPLLSMCGIQSICQYLKIGGKLEASGNAPGCDSLAEIEAACVVSTGEAFSEKNALRFSPNPAGDFLKIELPENVTAPEDSGLAVAVFDVAGKLVLEKRLAAAGQMLDLRGLPPGVFALKVVAGERVFSGKFVKQ